MMDRRDLSAIAKSLGLLVREYVGAAIVGLVSKEQLEARLKELPDPIPGPQGERGEKGDSGLTIIGERGTPGEKGADGKDGRDGRDGKDGRDGEPGRDALDIAILPEINGERSYPRGTFAIKDGGLWRTVEADRWEVLLNGIQDITLEQGANPRHFMIRLFQTNGKETEFAFSMPVLIYQGVFKDGAHYEKGDVVGWGGSVWYCLVDGTKDHPEVPTKDWQLMVREGRPGKDAKK